MSDWLVKISLLGEADTAVRLDIKPGFGEVSLAQVTHLRPVIYFLMFKWFHNIKDGNNCVIKTFESKIIFLHNVALALEI